MGLLIIGAMTGLLLRVLHTMPRVTFAGVFCGVGIYILGSRFYNYFLTHVDKAR